MNTKQKITEVKISLDYARRDMATLSRVIDRAARDNGADYKTLDKIEREYNMIYRAINDAQRRVKIYEEKHITSNTIEIPKDEY